MSKSILYLVLLEFKKFKNNAVVKILLGIFTILFPILMVAGRDAVANLPPPIPSVSTFYSFPTVWDYQGYVGNWLVSILLGFVMIYIITSEVSFRTMRQNIIMGLRREIFFYSKLVTLILLSLYATVLYVLTTLLLGFFNTDDIDLVLLLDNNGAIIRFFLMSVGYLSFALMLSFVFRKGTLTLLGYFLYIMMLENLLRLIHVYFFKNRTMTFWPMNVVEDLMPFPPFKIPDYYINEEWNFQFLLTYNEAIFGTILYSALFIYIGYRSMVKKDV